MGRKAIGAGLPLMNRFEYGLAVLIAPLSASVLTSLLYFSFPSSPMLDHTAALLIWLPPKDLIQRHSAFHKLSFKVLLMVWYIFGLNER